MTHTQLDAMLAESGLAPEEATGLADLLAPLAVLSDEAPAPSVELIRIFGGDAPRTSSHQQPVARRRRRRHRSRGTVAGVVVLALSGVGATGLSAAANTLPSAWQHEVAGFSHDYLPFDFPEPPARKPGNSLRAPDAGPAQPRGAEGGGARPGASMDATRSANLRPDAGAAAWQGGPSVSGHQTHDRTDPVSTPPGSHVSSGDRPGEHSSAEKHEVRGSSQTTWPRHGTDEDKSWSKDRERDREKNRDKDRDKVKGNDNDNDEYDRAGDRPGRGGGIDAPEHPQQGKPSGGGDHRGSGKDRPGDKPDEHNDPPAGDTGDEGPAEMALPDPVGDPLSGLSRGAQDPLQGDAPRT